MKNITTKERIRISMTRLLLCLCMAVSLLVPAQPSAAQEKTVRIGYYEGDQFQSGASDKAVKRGYAYEYIQRLRMYSGWNYEYVYGEFGELYKKLAAGEIDMLAGLAYREERTGIIGYPELEMGDVSYAFLKRTSSTELTSNPQTIDGKRIGVLDSNMVVIVERYLEENNITAEIMTFDKIGDRDKALQSGAVDIIIVEGDSEGRQKGVETFAGAGMTNYYLCTSLRRPDLLAELNRAQAEMFEANPELRDNLRKTWFRRNAVNMTLSDKELAWAEAHKTFTVGYYDNFLPYSDRDEEGRVTGMVKDIVPELFRLLQLKDIKINYRGYASYNDMREALLRHEVDAVFPMYSAYWPAEQYNFSPTDSVLSTYFILVYKGDFPNPETAKIAVNSGNILLDSVVSMEYSKNARVYCDSVRACIDAVADGKADAALINGLRAEYLLRSRADYASLQIQQIPNYVNIGFAVNRSDTDTAELLNHAIRLMEPSFALSHASQYEEKHTVTVAEFLRSHLWLVLGVILLIAAIIISFVLRELRRSREHLAKEERQKAILQDKVSEISILNEILQEKQSRLEVIASEQKTQLAEGKKPAAVNEEQSGKPRQPNDEPQYILLADDSEVNAEIAVTVLQEFGYEVEHAENGKICLDMMKHAPAGHYALVLIDTELPVLNGYETLRAIRGLEDKEKAVTPVAAMITQGSAKEKKEAEAAGASACLGKPIEISELIDTIEELLN